MLGKKGYKKTETGSKFGIRDNQSEGQKKLEDMRGQGQQCK